MIEVREGDRAAAFAVPFEVYPRDSAYVSPMRADLDRYLDPARNPLVTEGHGRLRLFTAHRDGRPVGRIVASIHDASNARHGQRQGRFGFFDCADDPEAAAALLGRVEGWARERGMAEVAGNFNLTAMQQVGVLTDGFGGTPYTDMVWSPPHVARLLAANGYAPTFPMTTHEADLTTLDPGILLGERQRAILSDPDYRFVPITRRGIKTRLAEARLVLNDGFDQNPMFVPTTEAEFSFQAGEMMWVLDPRIAVMVHHRGRPAGVVICIPDLNPLMRATRGRVGLTTPWHFLRHRLNRKRAVIVFYSVARELHGRGLNGAMLHKVTSALKAAGYTRLGITWIADENASSLRQMEKIGARPLHRLHLFRKDVTAP